MSRGLGDVYKRQISFSIMFSRSIHTVAKGKNSSFLIAKCWKEPKCPSVSEWIKKLWCIYTMEYYTAEGEKELLPFATAWMDLESIMLSEINQAVEDKYHVISPISGT